MRKGPNEPGPFEVIKGKALAADNLYLDAVVFDTFVHF